MDFVAACPSKSGSSKLAPTIDLFDIIHSSKFKKVVLEKITPDRIKSTKVPPVECLINSQLTTEIIEDENGLN
jgi:hypothetical protein